jgi:hypothetical protein
MGMTQALAVINKMEADSIGDRQELNRPARDHDSLLVMLV